MRVDVFEDSLARLRALCARLPEVREELAWVGTRWKIRGNTFAHVLEIVDGWPPSYARAASTGGPATVLTFRSTDVELAGLVRGRTPFFGPLWGRSDVGVVLAPDTDWDEIVELITESYRLRAPKRLAGQLD